MREPQFLTVEEILHLHRQLVGAFGGDVGVFDPGRLEASVAQPAMTAFGQLLHPTLVEQAAAYLFHLVANHAFCDGNKRIGLHAALVFLETNGVEVIADEEAWYAMTMALAKGALRKTDLVERMRSLITLP